LLYKNGAYTVQTNLHASGKTRVHEEKVTLRQTHIYTSRQRGKHMCMHKETYRQRKDLKHINVLQAKRQRCLQVEIKTLMLTKFRQTTHIDEKNFHAGN
jgi:hypothetical protein